MTQAAEITTQFVDALNAKWSGAVKVNDNGDFSQKTYAHVSVEPARRYDRIYTNTTLISTFKRNGKMDAIENRKILAFIDKSTGGILKPGSAKAPQDQIIRYLLSDDEGFRAAVDEADLYGGFLYKK